LNTFKLLKDCTSLRRPIPVSVTFAAQWQLGCCCTDTELRRFAWFTKFWCQFQPFRMHRFGGQLRWHVYGRI